MQFAGLDQYAVKLIYTNPPGRGPNAGVRVTQVYSDIMAADPDTAVELAVTWYTAAGKLDIEVLEVTRLWTAPITREPTYGWRTDERA